VVGLEEILLLWALRDLKKKKKGRKMWVHLVMCDKQVIANYFRRYEDRRSEVLLILECLWTLEELYETSEESLQPEGHKYV
jgi:hypothetical protein